METSVVLVVVVVVVVAAAVVVIIIIIIILLLLLLLLLLFPKSHDSSVGIALGYGLDDRGFKVRFPAGAGNFSLYHRVQNCSGAHPASYPMSNRGSFPGGKAAVA
jgi:hypothetical protein